MPLVVFPHPLASGVPHGKGRARERVFNRPPEQRENGLISRAGLLAQDQGRIVELPNDPDPLIARDRYSIAGTIRLPGRELRRNTKLLPCLPVPVPYRQRSSIGRGARDVAYRPDVIVRNSVNLADRHRNRSRKRYHIAPPGLTIKTICLPSLRAQVRYPDIMRRNRAYTGNPPQHRRVVP